MNLEAYVPVLMLGVLAAGFAIASVLVSGWLAPKNPTPAKLTPYECGITPADVEEIPGHRFPIKFYLIAMLFIVFDIEVVFLFPWAVIFKRLGVPGLIEMGIFMLFLFGAFIYIWRRGGLEWEPPIGEEG